MCRVTKFSLAHAAHFVCTFSLKMYFSSLGSWRYKYNFPAARKYFWSRASV